MERPKKSYGNTRVDFEVYHSFAQIPGEFESLFDEAAKESVFFAEEWFRRSIEHFLRAPQSLRIFAAKIDGIPIALLFVVETPLTQKAPWLKRSVLSSCTISQSFRSSLVCSTHCDVVELLIALTRYLCLLYTSPSPRDATLSRMPSSA